MQVLVKIVEVIIIMGIFVALVHYSSILGKQVFGKGEYNIIKVKYHGNTKLNKLPQGDWIDLYSSEDVVMKKGEYALISLGISMKLPDGFEAHVVPRSSTFKTWGIIQTNSMGVIDNSYSGNGDIWKFPAYATRNTEIKVGDRICQFRIIEKANMQIVEVDDLGDNNRGGFGSTGKQ